MAHENELSWPHAVTLVVATDTASQRGWAAATAIEIARRLAAKRKVVLVDLLSRPSPLAAAIGVEESRGIVDVLFRGASFSAVACKLESEGFHYLPLGETPPAAQAVCEHSHWLKMAERLPDADAHVLPVVAAGDWQVTGPIAGFESCIVLNGSGAEIDLPVGARPLAEFLAPPSVRGGLGPEWAPEPEAEEGLAAVEAEDEIEPAAPPAELPEPSPAPPLRPLLAPEPRRHFLSGPNRRSVVPVAALVAATATVVVLSRGVGTPETAAELTDLGTAAEPIAPSEPPAVAASEINERDRPGETSLPYSVAIAAYSAYDDAVARQRKWERPDLTVYVAPTPVRGVVYYRVFAGLLPNRDQAERLMAQLVREGIKDTIRNWDVRATRYVFDFGTYPDARDAGAAAESLRGQGVPAYVVPAAGADGGRPAYHVYAGGYESAEAARPLRERIVEAGIEPRLVERVGLVSR